MATTVGRRPRVLYLVPLFGYPPRGGPRLRTYHTVVALSRCADVLLHVWQTPDVEDEAAARAHMLEFCQDVWWPSPPAVPNGPKAAVRRAVRQALPKPVVDLLRSALSRRRAEPQPGEAAPEDHGPLLAALAERIERDDVDVIWLGFGGISYHLLPLKAMTGRPLVVETESIWSQFVLREAPFIADPAERERVLAAGRAKQEEERLGAQVADITTAVSEVEADYFRGLAPDPSAVMPIANVIDVDAYRRDASPPVPLETPAICFPGTMSRGTANIGAVAWLCDEVMPGVWDRLPDLHLYLVGRHPAPEILARRGRRVHVTGEVASVVPYLRQSLATVVPLRWESGTRFKILEAFACGTPVVSTTLGAEGLDVEHGRHLLLADTPEALADAILAVATQPDLREKLAAAGGELVREKYSLDAAERQSRAVLARVGFEAPTAQATTS